MAFPEGTKKLGVVAVKESGSPLLPTASSTRGRLKNLRLQLILGRYLPKRKEVDSRKHVPAPVFTRVNSGGDPESGSPGQAGR